MQLDRTQIAIRERSLLETLDLALQVTRRFAEPLVPCALFGILPMALINYALIGWMVPSEFDETTVGVRYLWNTTALIYLEAPLASAFIVAFLGPAVFLEQRTIRQVVGDVFRFAPQLLLSQGLLRGLFAAWALYLFVEREQANAFVEGFLLIVVMIWSTAARAFRPYINEIILLEKNPLRARTPNTITISKRGTHLHGPYSGDLVIRWIGSAAVGLLLFVLTLAAVILIQGFLISHWPVSWTTSPFELVSRVNWIDLEIIYPACLWLVAVFMSVVRFLSYLDLRIRHEGWEVELFMRAESLRLATQVE
jgi:hypothetical protein